MRLLSVQAFALLFVCSVASAEPLPEPGKDTVVSLDAILSYADEFAPQVIIAKKNVARSEPFFEAAKIKYPQNPNLYFYVGPRLGGESTSFDLQFSITQDLEINKERSYRKKVAEAQQDISLAEVEVAKWEAHNAVHRAFYEALIAKERVKAAERLLTFTQELLDITNRRLKAGDVSSLAVKLSEIDVAQAKQNKLLAESEYRSSCLQLALASGWPVSSPIEPKGEILAPRKTPSLNELLNIALSNHPSLKTQSAIIAAANEHVSLADVEAKPEPFVGLYFTQEAGIPGETIGALQFGFPLARFQKNQSERSQARAERSIAEVTLETLKKNLEGEVALAAERVNSAADRIAIYGTEIIPTFESNLALLKKAFELGEIDILQISVAQEKFLALEGQALDAYSDYYRSVGELEAELGAEIWPDP
jgi:cobalt-zinc-cadmium efflux system outer membrane protein